MVDDQTNRLVADAQARYDAARAMFDAATGPWIDVAATELTAAQMHLDAVYRAIRLQMTNASNRNGTA